MQTLKINKKADLMPEESLKILLAVFGLIILFVLAFNLYGIFINNTKLQQAQATLDSLVGKAQVLEINSSTSMLIVSPKDWIIYFFNNNEDSPKDCKGSYCTCVCKIAPSSLTSLNEIISSCEKEGICKKSSVFIWPDLKLGTTFFQLKNLPKEFILENKFGRIYLSPLN